MKKMPVLLFVLTGIFSKVHAAGLEQLFNIDLPPLPENQEVAMLTVEYQPGESGMPHRHNAHTFVYVLEGSIVMQVAGGAETTLVPGEVFYENPDDVHVTGKNASSTLSAKFLVYFIKTKNAPATVPVP